MPPTNTISADVLAMQSRGFPSEPARMAGPSHLSDKSAVLDYAYDEYCQRIEHGDPVDPNEFCERFPACQSSLHRLLQAHRFIHENPLLLDNLRPIAWPVAGQTFAGYDLVHELGKGAFARVFLATQAEVGNRRVAVKISRNGKAEARTLGRIEHPNVVPIHSVEVDDASGLTIICMPFLGSATMSDAIDRVAGQDGPPETAGVIVEAILSNAIREIGDGGSEANRSAKGDNVVFRSAKEDLSHLAKSDHVDCVRRWALSLAEALAFVHARGIFHRDLKPSNILLDAGGQPRLLDFNLARDGQMADHRIGGTLPYMSPEQLKVIFARDRADALAVAAPTDVFSLGVILYELLTGKHPFGPIPLKLGTKELRAHLLERQRTKPRSLRRVNPRVDRRLAALIESCLAFDPNARPSAAALAAALRKSLSPERRAVRWIGSRSWCWRAAASAALLAGIFAIVGLSLREPYGTRQWHRGQEHFQAGRNAEALECFNRALEADPNLTPALFDRGRARARLGQFNLALADFKKLDELAGDGKTKACIGYCQAGLNQYSEAVIHFRKAIEANYAPAEVLNDLGFAYLCLGKYNDAKTALDDAVKLDTKLAATYHNRALLNLTLIQIKKGMSPEQGIADIEKAIALQAGTADLYRDAACLHAAGGRLDAALDYLLQAADKGLDARRLGDDAQFKELKDKPQFKELTRRPAPAAIPEKAPRLVDPIGNGN